MCKIRWITIFLSKYETRISYLFIYFVPTTHLYSHRSGVGWLMTSLAAEETGRWQKVREGLQFGRLVLPGCMDADIGRGGLMPPVKGLESRGLEGGGQQRCPVLGLGQCCPFSCTCPPLPWALILEFHVSLLWCQQWGQPHSWSMSLGLAFLLVMGVWVRKWHR